MKKLFVMLMCATLMACGGGGGDDEDEHVDNRPPQCQANPNLCK